MLVTWMFAGFSTVSFKYSILTDSDSCKLPRECSQSELWNLALTDRVFYITNSDHAWAPGKLATDLSLLVQFGKHCCRSIYTPKMSPRSVQCETDT